MFINDIEQPNPDFILPNDELKFYGFLFDPGRADTHIIQWILGDGNITFGNLTQTHAYAEPGTYNVTFRAWDDDGGIGWHTIAIEVISVTSAVETIIEDVEDIELLPGTENSLISKLEGAIESLKKENNNSAANKINAFINEIEALSGKKITQEEADELITIAKSILDSI